MLNKLTSKDLHACVGKYENDYSYYYVWSDS